MEGGIYRTTDGGDKWTEMNNGYLGYPRTNDIVIDPSDSKTLYAGTFKGVWSYTFSSVGNIDDKCSMQSKFTNKAIVYSNLGRGNIITFKYYLHSGAQVTLRIYNVQSKLISFITEYKQAGHQTTQLSKSGIPAGLYLYQISTKDDITGKKQKWKAQKQIIIH